MKRIITLALALVIAFGAVTSASAIDVQVKGQWVFGIGWYDNKDFYSGFEHKSNSDDAFNARHRIRTQIDFIASEQLKGVLMFEIGTLFWGRGGTMGRGAGGQLDADGVNVETKRAFIDWMVPGSDLAVRMGIQYIGLPSATGFMNPVLSSDVAGISLNYKFTDSVSATLFWARPFDDAWNDNVQGRRLHDELDVFGLMVPISLDGFKLTPWTAYASIGGASGWWDYRRGNESDGGFTNSRIYNSREHGWWAGLGVAVDVWDPLSLRFDVTYGHLSGDANNMTEAFDPWTADPRVPFSGKSPKASGWFMDAAIDYKFDWGLAGIFGWYATGDDWDDIQDGEIGRMPMIGADVGFGPTYMGTCGGRGWMFDKAVTRSGIGLWGIGARLKDLSFVDKLKHTLVFAYMQGTNDHEIVENLGFNAPGRALNVFGDTMYLTDKDSAYEINFINDYKIYDNLTFTLNTGIVWLDLDGDVWKKDASGNYGSNTDPTWTVEFLFEYTF